MIMAAYSMAKIAGFLTTEKLALHGVSPEVYDQNRAIVWSLDDIAARLGKGVLGVQLIGSRAAGYSCPTSDIDFNVIATDVETKSVATETIKNKLTILDPNLKANSLGAMVTRIYGTVPINPEEFTKWVMKGFGIHGIFGDGVVRSRSLTLLRLAALHTIDAQASSDADRQERYTEIRDNHASVFLGKLPRAQQKWAERLDMPLDDVEAATAAPYETRRQNFGLPLQIADYHAALTAWAAGQEELRSLHTYDLYRTVVGAKASR